MLMLLIFGSVTFGQATASLATDPATTASPGEAVLVPLMVTNFNSIGAIQFAVILDPQILSCTGIINRDAGLSSGFLEYHQSGSTLFITWTATSTFPSFNGKLFDVNFIYTGPGTSPLNFYPTQCEVAHGDFTILPVEYTNGSVSQDLTITTKATLVGGTANTGGPVTAQLRFEDFLVNAGAITQKVHYDVSKLDFVSAIGQGTLAGVIGNAGGGVITLTWTNTAGADINWTAGSPTNKILLNFVYTGNTTANLEFYPGCIISTPDPVTNIKVSYYNGMVEPGAAVAHATLGSVAGALQGTDYEIPLTLSGFDALGANTAGAITLTIPYDSPKLSFINASYNPHGANVNANGSYVSIVWTNPAPGLLDGEFLKLNFKYNGVGDAHLDFGAGCLFTTTTGDAIQVGYTNGLITPGGSANAYIGVPASAIGADVAVPVYFTDMPPDVGAVTLNIAFDFSKLSYIQVTDFPAEGSANVNVTGNIIHIVWTSPTPWAAINTTPFCNLNFHVSGGGQAPVNFDNGCEIANNALPTPSIIPTIFHNGGVNLVYKVSGILTYDNPLSVPPNTPLAGITVYLKQGVDPYPNTIPIPTIAASTTTDVNGYFEMFVANGTYWLDGDRDFPLWSTDWVNGGDIINIQRYIGGLSNSIGPITPTPPWTLRQKAANVFQNAVINGGDIIVLQRRIGGILPNPNYTAGDMTFEHTPVTILNAPVVQNFKGLSTGDVNGSYNP